ncbi:hypothetical protein [uncultured Algibacter sp.]|uniref:hypothetical protein n=1 Tax=uncultured Algibacter sp. TaxID=298659 RepID=UPI003432D574
MIDFTKWMIAVMNKRLLSKESYNELLKVHSIPKKGKYYALGFETFEKPYHTLFFHGGNNDGFTGAYILDVEKKWGFVLFTNSEMGQDFFNKLLYFLIEE